MKIRVKTLRNLIKEAMSGEYKNQVTSYAKSLAEYMISNAHHPESTIANVLRSEMQDIWGLSPDEDLNEEVLYLLSSYVHAEQERNENSKLQAKAELTTKIRNFVLRATEAQKQNMN